MKWIVTILCFVCVGIASAQPKNKQLVFDVNINKNPMELGRKYYLESIADSIEFETFKFYISNFELLRDGEVVEQLSRKYFLIDLEKPTSQTIDLSTSNIRFNQIRFCLGIDSITNYAGAMGGDLDPTNGMYWTWQSGYIHIKIEGKSPACDSRNNNFQLHIGGFQSPFNSLQTVELNVGKKKSNATVQLSLNQLFESVNIKKNYQVMSPNQHSVKIAKAIADNFKMVR